MSFRPSRIALDSIEEVPRWFFAGLLDLTAWVVFEAHIEALEYWTSFNAIGWGLWLLNPWNPLFNERNIFAVMAVVPQWVWGVVAVTGGGLQIVGRLSGKPTVIRVGARTLACFWMFGAGALAWQNWHWFSSVTYPALAAAALLVSYRASPSPTRAGDAWHGI